MADKLERIEVKKGADQRESGLIVIGDEEAGGKRIRLLATSDKIKAYITIKPLAPFIEVRLEEFERLVESKGILLSDDRRDDLQELVVEVTDPKFDLSILDTMPAFLIAEGIAPKQGQDGYLDWNIDVPEPDEIRLKEDNKGSVDFREIGRVINVREEDLLVTVVEPTKGENGTDIYGKPVVANNGQKAKFTKGKNLLNKEGSIEYYSAIDGCVKWNGTTLSVEPVYIVEGDVDFDEGNIHFNGSVVVQKDVKEGFEIEARDDIEIKGLCEPCTLKAEGNIKVLGGINGGSGIGRIMCKGNLYAKYLNNANVECEGDVIVQSQIVTSEINCTGRVICLQGSIVGGKTVALGGIETATAGSETGGKTTLIVNVEHFQTQETREIDESIRAIDKKVDQIHVAIKPILEDQTKLAKLDPKNKERVCQLIETMERYEEDRNELIVKRNGIVSKFLSKISNEIIVRKVLYSGVDARIDTCRQVFINQISGPIRLKPNYAKGIITISSCN
ncbi:MAG: FapA family protein [Planctomycetes bacterium]|nr:FapA family protein [Planctomycetota bacterium]